MVTDKNLGNRRNPKRTENGRVKGVIVAYYARITRHKKQHSVKNVTIGNKTKMVYL